MFRNYDMESYLLKNKTLIYAFLAAILSYGFVYGFEITHFTLSIDEEPMDNFAQTLSAGRWGHALLRHYILPEPFVPFFTLAISLIILSAANAFSAFYLKLSKLQSIIFCIMAAAMPQMAYQFEFSNQADTISISILCSVISVALIRKPTIKNCIGFIALTVFSLSIYQSIFLYAASLICVKIAISSAREEITVRGAMKDVFIFSILVVISLALNAVLARVVGAHYNVPISSYLSSIVGWGKADIHQTVLSLVDFIKTYFTFGAAFGINSFPFILIPLLSVVVASVLGKQFPLLVALSSVAVVASAFLLNIAIGTGLPPRAMTQIPVVFAGMFIIAVIVFRLRASAILVSVVFLAVGASSSNKMFYSDYMARESDKIIATQMISEIYRKYPDTDLSKTPVFFYGSYTPFNSWRIPSADVFGASFFEWDGGNNRRMYNYLSAANIASIKAPDARQVSMARTRGASLPSWPNRSSVSLVDGVIIIKLSDKLSDYNR